MRIPRSFLEYELLRQPLQSSQGSQITAGTMNNNTNNLSYKGHVFQQSRQLSDNNTTLCYIYTYPRMTMRIFEWQTTMPSMALNNDNVHCSCLSIPL